MSTQKQQFKNESGGFLGVVVIGPKGSETGIPVEPGGYVWLSEEEQVLTANAPRRPEDNPFVEQSRESIDPESGEVKTVKFTPLVSTSDARYVPSQARFVPATMNDAQAIAHAAQAATGEQPETATAVQPSPETRSLMGTAAMPGTTAPPVPPRAAAAAAASAPVQPPTTPEAPQETPEPPTTPEAPQEPQTTPQEAPVIDEETAAVVDSSIGEETGAAKLPETPAVEGEYQAGEEVGTPTAPTQPAPYSPPSE